MITKLLGILDILCAIFLGLFYFFHFIPVQLMMAAGLYLGAKGAFFLISKDIASIFDVICALVIFTIIAFPVPYPIMMLCCLFLVQKGIFSLLV